MSETFTCEACHSTYEREWTEEEALAEARDLWGKDIEEREVVRVCDDCFQLFMRQLSN